MKTNTFKTELRTYIVLVLFLCFGFNNSNAQVDLTSCGYSCTTNSFSITDIYLSSTDVPGTELTNTSCTPGTIVPVYMIMNVSSNRNAAVHCSRIVADLMVGDSIIEVNQYLGTLPSANNGTVEKLVYGPFDWVCGELLTLENVMVVWRTNANNCPGENYDCSTYSNSQCQFPEDLLVSTPLAVQYDYTVCTTGTTALVNFESTTIGGTSPYSYTWNYDGGILQGGTASSPIVSYDINGGPYNPTLSVTDINGNTNVIPYSELLIFQTELLNTTLSNDLTCSGNDGSGSFTASGGTPPYSFNIDSNTTGAFTSMNGPPSTVLSFINAGIGSITVTITDDAGCTATETITISAGDTTDPTWTNAPTNMSVECDGTVDPSGAFVAWLVSFLSTDDSGGTVTVTNNNVGGLSSLCGATGSATVTFTATDDCGNFITQDATFTIVDTTAPNIDTPASDSTVECDGSGNTDNLNAWLASNGGATASDDCSTITWSILHSNNHQ